MFELLWPWMLALLPLPFAVWFWAEKQRKKHALKAPLYDSWVSLDHKAVSASKRFPWILLLIWCCMVLASARPQWVGEPLDLPASGRDLLISIDISGSMEMEDMMIADQPVNRLVAVKALLSEFIERRKGDRLGLILFGEQAYLQTPLTFDLETVGVMLNETEIGLAGSSRTAIGDSIGLAIKRLRERSAENRVLILLTDGQNNTGILNPIPAAQLAEHAGVTIYTIGVGADELVVKNRLFGNRKINPSLELDEETLIQVAEKTGGRYFRARNTQELRAIYEQLDLLEPVEDDPNTYRPIKALFYIPLAIALLLSFAYVLWNQFQLYRLRKLHAAEQTAINNQPASEVEHV